MKYFTTEIVPDWDAHDLTIKFFMFIFLTRKYNILACLVLTWCSMEKGLIRVYCTTIGPLHQLNSFWIHYQISTISDLKQMRSQREVLTSALKIFIWFSCDTIFGFRHMFFSLWQFWFFNFHFKSKIPSSIFKIP